MDQTSVKIMQCAIAKQGQIQIDCIGVGVGVILYNQAKKVAAGLHVLVPRSATVSPPNPVKFANLAIPHALQLLEKEGVSPPFTVSVAGGAAMEGSAAGTSMGSKIVDALKEALEEVNLKIALDETGGSKIRSMILDVETGKVDIT
jgi:chemotaxis receptor (MCP) glutamine deamidase CheD